MADLPYRRLYPVNRALSDIDRDHPVVSFSGHERLGLHTP